MLAKQAVSALFSGLGSLFGGPVGGLLGGAAGNAAGGGLKLAQGGVSSGPVRMLGGDATSATMRVPRFAAGTVVSKPTFALVGDSKGNPARGSPEAVIPLRRGANGDLGVQSFGAGMSRESAATPANITVINVSNMQEAAQAAALAALRDPKGQIIVNDIVTGDYMRGGSLHRAVRAKR